MFKYKKWKFSLEIINSDAAMNAYVKAFGWTSENDSFFIQNHEDKIKSRNIEEKLKFERASHVFFLIFLQFFYFFTCKIFRVFYFYFFVNISCFAIIFFQSRMPGLGLSRIIRRRLSWLKKIPTQIWNKLRCFLCVVHFPCGIFIAADYALINFIQ